MENRRFNFLKDSKSFNTLFQHILGAGSVFPSSRNAGCGRHSRCPLPVCPRLRAHLRPPHTSAPSGHRTALPTSSSGPRRCPVLGEKSWKREETPRSPLGFPTTGRALKPRHTPGCPRSRLGDLLQAGVGPQDGFEPAPPELGSLPGLTLGS